jgi:hypothetical protein
MHKNYKNGYFLLQVDKNKKEISHFFTKAFILFYFSKQNLHHV